MKKSSFALVVVALTGLTLVAATPMVLAGAPKGPAKETGYGPGMRGGHGPRHDGLRAAWNSLSQEDREKITEQKKAFLEETTELRREMRKKHLDLARELAEKNPDPQKAKAVQGGLSELQARLDQKRIEHWITIRRMVPNLDTGSGRWAMKGRKGYGWRDFGDKKQ